MQLKIKNLVLTVIFVSISLFSISQSKLESYALQIGHWNIYTEKYTWETVKYCDVEFLVQGDVIVANDAAESTYYTFNNFEHSQLVNSWDAYDEDRRKCIVTMMFGKTSYFIVTYSDICYKYFVNI
jgi:hypothetical protein